MFLMIYLVKVLKRSKFIVNTAIALYNEYKAKYETINQERTSGQSTNEGSSIASIPAIPSARARYIKRRRTLSEEIQSELARYLSEAIECESPNFDILHYWKINSEMFTSFLKWHVMCWSFLSLQWLLNMHLYRWTSPGSIKVLLNS